MKRSRENIHVVVTCSNRKAIEPSEQLKARNLKSTNPETRAKKWLAAIASGETQRRPAKEIYTGNHWAVARTIPELSDAHTAVRLWVASAGYGFISDSTPIQSYAATFSPGHEDTVVSDRRFLPYWWEALNSGYDKETPRNIASLVEAYPRDAVLVAISEPYLGALADDLEEAHLRAKLDRFTIICGGWSRAGKGRHSRLLETPERLQSNLGGSKIEFNVRAARRAIQFSAKRKEFSLAALREHFGHLSATSKPIVRAKRVSLGDDQIADYIRTHLSANPTQSRTRLLRNLRDEGQACEQSRFAAIYRSVMNERIPT